MFKTAFALFGTLLLAGCGLTGELYLPEEETAEVAPDAPAAEQVAESQTNEDEANDE